MFLWSRGFFPFREPFNVWGRPRFVPLATMSLLLAAAMWWSNTISTWKLYIALAFSQELMADVHVKTSACVHEAAESHSKRCS